VIAAACIAFEVITQGFCVSAARGQTLGNAEFQESKEVKALRKLHDTDDKASALHGVKWEKNGYPDMGNGPVGRLLSYEKWSRLAWAQRAHYNGVEGVTSAVTFTLIAGLGLPTAAAISGFIIVVGRMLYGMGYRSRGPGGRFTGALMFNLAVLANFGMSIYTGGKVAGYW